MRTEEFVMRGQTPGAAGTSGKENEEILNFSGFKPGYAYKLIEFKLWPSAGIGSNDHELAGSITASKTAMLPTSPDFNDEGLIGVSAFRGITSGITYSTDCVNDTFLITQNLILKVEDTSSSADPVNWQCKFMPVKMTASEEAVANYKQFTISDG